jgi:hypothetical protein
MSTPKSARGGVETKGQMKRRLATSEADRLASASATPEVHKKKRAKKIKSVEAEVEPEAEGETEFPGNLEEGEEKSDNPDEENGSKSGESKSDKSGLSESASEDTGHDSEGRSVIEKDGIKMFRSKENSEFDATQYGCSAWMSKNDVMNTLAERLLEAQSKNPLPTVVQNVRYRCFR